MQKWKQITCIDDPDYDNFDRIRNEKEQKTKHNLTLLTNGVELHPNTPIELSLLSVEARNCKEMLTDKFIDGFPKEG